VERLIKDLYVPFLTDTVGFGPSQFAYTKERGARDALAHLVLTWIKARGKKSKVAVYCSDVSGAFDRVKTDRLITKLRAKKLRPEIVAVLQSWLRQRVARVVVGGETSDEIPLRDMVYLGAVLGPILWNVFYEDARRAVEEWLFTEVVYADDLNAYRVFKASAPNEKIYKCLKNCQADLHDWGKANQVAFDPAKESMHILSTTEPHGNDFKLLGVDFDCALDMTNAVHGLVTDAGWKLRTLLRTRRYDSDAELVILYKGRLLSFLEYRTPAIYHARWDLLNNKLDNVQTRFLRDANIDDVTALMDFNLAPLAVRRDIAMLGLIHRAVLGKGPDHFRVHFEVQPGRLVKDPRSQSGGNLLTRSALGLAAIYNLLSVKLQILSTVSMFQAALQQLVKDWAANKCNDWASFFSPRLALHNHPLRGVL
jgi:hypothetical protein